MKSFVSERRAPRPRSRAIAAACAFAAWAAMGWAALGGCGATEPRVAEGDGGAPDASPDAGVQFFDAALDTSTASVDAGAAGGDAGAPRCEATPCDPRLPRPCGADATGACRLGAEGPRCEGPVGAAGPGDACAAAAACGLGLECFAEPDGGRCARPCCAGDPMGCAVGERCAGGDPLVDGTATAWGRCVAVRACDVLAPEGVCAPGEGCYIVSPGGETDCRPAGGVPVGAACEGEADCVPGAFCAGLMARACVRICAVGAGACPSGEGMCRAYPYSPPGTGICS